jgi:hypothetical protein
LRLHEYHWGHYEWDDDYTSVIDEEGDLVIYGVGTGWPSFSYWLVPGTQVEERTE